MRKLTFIDFDIWHRNASLRKSFIRQLFKISPIPRGLSVYVHVCMCVTIVRAGHTFAKIMNEENDLYRFWHLPSKCVIAKIVLRYLAVLFEGEEIKILISLKGRKLAHTSFRVFCRFWHLPSNGVIGKLYSMTLTYLLKIFF